MLGRALQPVGSGKEEEEEQRHSACPWTTFPVLSPLWLGNAVGGTGRWCIRSTHVVGYLDSQPEGSLTWVRVVHKKAAIWGAGSRGHLPCSPLPWEGYCPGGLDQPFAGHRDSDWWKEKYEREAALRGSQKDLLPRKKNEKKKSWGFEWGKQTNKLWINEIYLFNTRSENVFYMTLPDGQSRP